VELVPGRVYDKVPGPFPPPVDPFVVAATTPVAVPTGGTAELPKSYVPRAVWVTLIVPLVEVSSATPPPERPIKDPVGKVVPVVVEPSCLVHCTVIDVAGNALTLVTTPQKPVDVPAMPTRTGSDPSTEYVEYTGMVTDDPTAGTLIAAVVYMGSVLPEFPLVLVKEEAVIVPELIVSAVKPPLTVAPPSRYVCPITVRLPLIVAL